MAVNQSRSALKRNMNDATRGARLIGFNDEGEACVWTGGYTFNVYDAAREWTESRAFTSGQMVDYQDEDTARETMEKRGFDVV